MKKLTSVLCMVLDLRGPHPATMLWHRLSLHNKRSSRACHIENLKTAFAGESQANRKYLAFARRAEKDGYPQIAKLFRAAAEAETIHALSHLQNMGGVASTLENRKLPLPARPTSTARCTRHGGTAKSENHKAKTCWTTPTRSNASRGTLPASPSRLAGGQGSGRHGRLPVPGVRPPGIRQAAEKCPICGLPAAKYQKMS